MSTQRNGLEYMVLEDERLHVCVEEDVRNTEQDPMNDHGSCNNSYER